MWKPFSLRKARTSHSESAPPFRFPTSGGGSYGGYGFWNDLFNGKMLPGADFDYVREAGDLWKNAVVAALMNFIICTFPEPQLVVMERVGGEKGKEEKCYEHPLLTLLDAPNQDDDDLTSLAQAFVFDWNLYGNAFWILERSPAGLVNGIQSIPRAQMAPLPDKTGVRRVAGFAYQVDGKTLFYPKDRVVHWRFGRDPHHPRLGLAPLLGACRDICGENELATLGAAIARNMGIPAYYVSPDSDDKQARLEDETITKLQKLWRDRFSRERRGDPFVSRQKIRVERLGYSPDELMADKSRAMAVSRICAALRIDPMVIGLPSESKTYANLKEAHRAVYDHNLIPTGDAFCSKLTRVFRQEAGYLKPTQRLAWDYSQVAALQEDMDALFERVGSIYDAGVIPRSSAKRMLGEAYDDADHVYATDFDKVTKREAPPKAQRLSRKARLWQMQGVTFRKARLLAAVQDANTLRASGDSRP